MSKQKKEKEDELPGRFCKECGERLHLSEFRFLKRRDDGAHLICLDCEEKKGLDLAPKIAPNPFDQGEINDKIEHPTTAAKKPPQKRRLQPNGTVSISNLLCRKTDKDGKYVNRLECEMEHLILMLDCSVEICNSGMDTCYRNKAFVSLYNELERSKTALNKIKATVRSAHQLGVKYRQ